jgi:hypothetical protein
MNLLPFLSVYANDTSAFNPAFWARESLIVLNETMMAAGLVHRDFENLVANYGDTVNTRKPSTLKAYRKVDADSVTIQDVSATNVQVKLDQHVHTSFMIKDGEESRSMVALVEEYLKPAVVAQARFIDLMVLGQVYQFLANQVGKAGGLTTTNAKDLLLDLRNKLNTKKVPDDGRSLILNGNSETTFLKLDLFNQVQQAGDAAALRNALLGTKFGFDMFRAFNMPSVATGNTAVTGAINNASGQSVGDTALTVDGFSAAIGNNSWVVVAGQVRRVVSTAGGSTPVTITVNRGLDVAVVDNDVVTVYTPAAVNLSAGYAVGWAKEITINSTTVAPQVGQAVSFGTASPGTSAVYTIIDVNGLVGITLDRPLEVALANTDKVNLGPAGNFNFSFHRNAIALVVRPLALPAAGIGARASVVNANNLSMRATLSYNAEKQGTLVTLDMLCGIKVLDTDLGAVLVG